MCRHDIPGAANFTVWKTDRVSALMLHTLLGRKTVQPPRLSKLAFLHMSDCPGFLSLAPEWIPKGGLPSPLGSPPPGSTLVPTGSHWLAEQGLLMSYPGFLLPPRKVHCHSAPTQHHLFPAHTASMSPLTPVTGRGHDPASRHTDHQ